MSKIKGRGNLATEARLLRILREFGIKGWRRQAKIFGKPDFTIPVARIAIFVDGCFWHGCRLHGSIPSSNRKFWFAKLSKNVKRDKIVNKTLKHDGWHVIRIWQHELKKPDRVAARISAALARQVNSKRKEK